MFIAEVVNIQFKLLQQRFNLSICAFIVCRLIVISGFNVTEVHSTFGKQTNVAVLERSNL